MGVIRIAKTQFFVKMQDKIFTFGNEFLELSRDNPPLGDHIMTDIDRGNLTAATTA